MAPKKILVVDDEPLVNEFLCETLRRKKFHVDLAHNGQSALDKLNSEEFDLVITDIRMPDVDGMQILKAAKKLSSDPGVIMITAYGTIENAVEAMKVGAYDYITKPFSADAIELVVDKFFDYQRLVAENKYLRKELDKKKSFAPIIGKSPRMQKVLEAVEMVAASKATVLIQGASGTGKELIARAIHYNSPRKKGPFIKTNCAALPEGLIESELFGHEKGAFTGAIRKTKGRFEMAHGGTLLLDEISEMHPTLQAKLLRVLQDKEFQKVGNPETIQVDVRIITTTNRDLKEEVRKGNFREDLYFRLNVVPIYLPTLKERKEDIPLLVRHFLKTYAKENNKPVEGLSDEAMEMLINYDWPGNVRELENAVERAVVMSQEKILQPKHFLLAGELYETTPEFDFKNTPQTLKEMERNLILKTLKEEKGNRTRTAKRLGISVRTLRNKLKEFRNKGVSIELEDDR